MYSFQLCAYQKHFQDSDGRYLQVLNARVILNFLDCLYRFQIMWNCSKLGWLSILNMTAIVVYSNHVCWAFIFHYPLLRPTYSSMVVLHLIISSQFASQLVWIISLIKIKKENLFHFFILTAMSGWFLAFHFPLNSNFNVDIFVVLYSMGARWQKHLNLGGTVLEVKFVFRLFTRW